jgi:hypothetical protein
LICFFFFSRFGFFVFGRKFPDGAGKKPAQKKKKQKKNKKQKTIKRAINTTRASAKAAKCFGNKF